VATAAQLNAPRGSAVDTSRNVYVADTTNNRIRRVDATTGIVTTAVGSGGVSPFSACSFTGTAATVKLNLPEDVAVDASGNLYIADTGQGCIRKVDTAGNVTPVAGGGATTTCNATMLATAVSLLTPRGVDVDSTGAVIVADSGRSCIRKVSGGNATFLAGGGATTTCNTTVTASSVSLSNPTSVAVNAANEVFVADTGRNCIRKVSGGNASFVAGGGATTTCSATGLATSVSLLSPEGVAVDSAGRVLVSDTGRDCLRMVTAGNVSRVAFTGTASATGDNGPAVAATVATPARVAVGPDGSLYVADRATTAASSVVRKIVGSWPP
jgi:sugar lactone lactonase YvrE